jgi:hypothetical protein
MPADRLTVPDRRACRPRNGASRGPPSHRCVTASPRTVSTVCACVPWLGSAMAATALSQVDGRDQAPSLGGVPDVAWYAVIRKFT